MFRTVFSAVVAVGLCAGVATAADERVGDPYPLAADPVTGESLVEVAEPVVVIHEGRQIHFADQESASTFTASPAEYLAKVDQQIIAQQKPNYPLDTCVVSGEKLGSMGEPVDVVVGNRLVRLCCAGCEDQVRAEPDKYIEKLDAAVVKAQADTYPLQTCPVSGQQLGSMGEPTNYVIGTQLVKFCCGGCDAMLVQNPAKYLAKIKAAKPDACCPSTSPAEKAAPQQH